MSGQSLPDRVKPEDISRVVIDRLRAANERLREERQEAVDTVGTVEAENDRLRAALGEALTAARVFNRGGMTWMEYDRLLASWETWVRSLQSDEQEATG